MPEAKPRRLFEYQARDGRIPFREWLDGLRDFDARVSIDARLARVRAGNLGHAREVGEGVVELKIDIGPGYRVYVGQHGRELVIVLAGGDKSSQQEDIENAKSNWRDFKARSSPPEAPRRKDRRNTGPRW